MRRVVITGLGAVTPLGVGARRSWTRIRHGESGIVPTVNHDNDPAYATIPSQVAGLVPRGSRTEWKWDAREWMSRDDERRMALFTQYAMVAAQEAVDDARCFPTSDAERENMGVILGSGIGNFPDTVTTSNLFHSHGHSKTPPLFIPRLLTNLAAGHLSTRYRLHGPNLSPSTACTTGLHAIIEAYHLIARSPPSTAPNLMLAGASEACIHPLALSAFARARSLSTGFNATPERASRPFDMQRDGFVIAEGAAVLVLEERERAMQRGARIYAEIGGAGMSGDAGHMTKPREDGLGAVLAMRRALGETGDSRVARGGERVRPREVGYVNAHATGTVVGDKAEVRALGGVLAGNGEGEKREEGYHHRNARDVNVSSTKGSTGHLLGAAGALEALFTTLAIYEDIKPKTINLSVAGDAKSSDISSNDIETGDEANNTPDDQAGHWNLNFLGEQKSNCQPSAPSPSSAMPAGAEPAKQDEKVNMALTNSFGFGGTNASLCLLKHSD